MKDKTKTIKGHKSQSIGLSTDKDGDETNGRSGGGGAGDGDVMDVIDVTDHYEFVASDDDDRLDLDPKKRHNSKEKKRKERIGYNIRKLWQLVPIEYHVSGHKETLVSMLEKSRDYVSFLQKKLDKYLLGQGDQALAQDVERLSKRVNELTVENERLLSLVKDSAAGGLEHWKNKQKTQNQDNTDTSIATNDAEEDKVIKEVKDKETKSKKKNTVSAHLKRFQSDRAGSLDTDDSETEAAQTGLMFGGGMIAAGAAGGIMTVPPLMIPPGGGGPNPQGLTPGGPMPFMQDSNGMMFLSPNMSAFLNSPAPNNHNSAPDDLNNPHAGLLTLANTATALTSSQPDNMTSSSMKTTSGDESTKPGKPQSRDPTTGSQDNQVVSCSVPTGGAAISSVSSIAGDSVNTTMTSSASQNSSLPVNSTAPVVSTNQIGPGIGGGTAPTLLPANQGSSSNGPTLIFQNGQLLLVPQSGQVPGMMPPMNADTQAQTDAVQPSSSAPSNTPSNGPSVLPTTAAMASGVSSQPPMPAGPGMRMRGMMGLPGSVPNQVLPNQALGTQQQIVIGPNGQPILLQNPNAPMFNQSQTNNDANAAAMGTSNQLTGSQQPGANQNPLGLSTQSSGPNQLPNALILPNGQVVPVVTQPQLLFPNSCLPVSGGYIMPTGNMARPPGTMATARMNAPMLPSTCQSQLNNPLGAGLLMTTATSLATVSTATSSIATGGGGVLRPPLITGLGQPQFLPPNNMAATSTSMATVTSLATSKNTSIATTRLSGASVVSSSGGATTVRPTGLLTNAQTTQQGAPLNMVVQQKGAAPVLVQGPQGPRLITAPAPLPANQITLGAPASSQTDALTKPTGSVTMATVSTGDGSSKALNAASTTLSTIKVTVPGTIPKTVVSMATAVLSADGTIVVTLPPGADPKNFVVNPASINPGALTSGAMTPGVMPKPTPTSGVSPAGQKGKPGGGSGGVGVGVGGSKGRVLMPKPSALLGAPTLGVPVACVTPDSVIHSPQSTGTPGKTEKAPTSQILTSHTDVAKPLSIVTSSAAIATKSASVSPSGSSSTNASGTDILAKAFFSSIGPEISPTAGNYDDNPLQIDTGAGEQQQESANEQQANNSERTNQQQPTIAQQPASIQQQQTQQQFPLLANAGQPIGQPMIMQQPVIIPQQLQLQQQEIQLLQQQQQQQQADATTKKPKKSKKKKKEKVKEGDEGKTGTSGARVSTPQPLFTVSVPGTTGCGTASLAPMGIPTTTLVGSNNMQLVGSNQQHIRVSSTQQQHQQEVGHLQQLQQPNSNMTDRSVDSGVGSDVAILDFIDDEHQMAALKDAKSPEKGHKVKGHHQVPETNAHKVNDKHGSIQGEGKKSKEKSPKDKSKKSKKSNKTKAALKQPPPEVIAAEISASINSLKSPSDVPDDLSMPFTLPGFEEFEQQETQSKLLEQQGTRAKHEKQQSQSNLFEEHETPTKHEKHKNSPKSKKKSKKDREKEETLNSGVSNETLSVVTQETPSKSGDAVRQADMLPDTITFTENELSDVLDQVESLGQSLSVSDASESTTPKSQAAVIMESVLDTPKFPPPITPTTPSDKKSKSRKKKKSTFETPDLPPSKKKRVSPSGGVVGSNPATAADILERAMEGIGPLDMDCSDPHDATGDGADADKMTIDLSAPSSESDHNLDSPPFIPARSPPKLTPPNSAKKKSGKNAIGVGATKGHDSDASDVLDDSSTSVPTFGYSPVKPMSDNRDKPEDRHQNRKNEDRERQNNANSRDNGGKDAVSIMKEKETTPQLGSSSAAFYSDMDADDLTISTENTRTEKPNSPSPVSMVRSGLLDIIPPMTPRTVDHLAKTLGCDPVTPFDGDSLANMDSDDYPWLNTPNLAPATPAQARHTNIASLARFDARPVATPKHPVTKNDANKSSSSSSQFNSQSKSTTNDAKLSTGSSSTGSSSTKQEVPSKTDKNDKTQEKSVNGSEPTGSSFAAPINYATNATNAQKPLPTPTLTIPPFSSPEKPSSANLFQSNSQNIPPNISPSRASGGLGRQSSNSELDKPGQSTSSNKTQEDSRGFTARVTAPAPGVTSPASLKPPGSNSSSSSTSPVKQPSNNNSNHSNNSSNSTKLSPQTGSGSGFSASNRLSPAGSGKSSSSVLSVVQPPMPLSKLSASMRPIDASVTPASSLRPIDASLPPASSAPMATTSMAPSISTNQGSGNSSSSGYSMGSRITSGFSQGKSSYSSNVTTATTSVTVTSSSSSCSYGRQPPGGVTSRQESFGFPPPPTAFTGGGSMVGGSGPPTGPPFPPFSLPTTSGTSTFSFSLSGSSSSSTDSTARYNPPTVPPTAQPQFPFYPPMPPGPMAQSMMPPPMQGSHVQQLNLPTFGMDSTGSGGMGSSNTGHSGGDRSQRNPSGSSGGTSQSPHGAGGMSGHYGMYGGGGGSASNLSETPRLSHSGTGAGGATNKPAQPPPPNQTMGTTPPNPQTPNRSVGRSPHNSFYSSNQFQSPPSGSQSQSRNPSSASQSAAPPLPTPPLHHHGSRISMDQSGTSNQGRPGYGSTASSQLPYGGGGSSNFTSGTSYEPPPLHYTSNRPPSTASNQSVGSQKSSSQSRTSSESRGNKSSSSSKSTNHKSSSSCSSSSSRSKQSSGNKKASASSASAGAGVGVGSKLYEVDTNLSNSIFETRSMTPMGIASLGMGLSPPPSRNLTGAPDGPTYIPGNLFNASRPLSNSNTLQHKPGHPADMTFNSLFPTSATRGPQNGLGLNFQPGFPPGMSPHGSHQSSGHMTPHTTSIPNYLGNMFPDMGTPHGGATQTASQGADSLNISPIKFQHSAHNPILGPPQPPPGLGVGDPPSALQHPHPHQGPPPPPHSLYTHNRAHPAMGINPMAAAGMSINSLLGQHHHHGFDPGRGMTPSTMTPPFGHVPTPSFGMPNFLMPDH